LLAAAPGWWEVAQWWRERDVPGTPPIARWALLLVWLGGLRVLYGVSLWLTPDWSAARVVTVVELITAALFAFALGMLWVASPSGWLATTTGLGLGEKIADGQAALWALCLASTSVLVAFFAGRLVRHWQRARELLDRARRPSLPQ
jgi:hypothetical protein